MERGDILNKLEIERFTTILLSKQAELSGSIRARDEIIIEKAADELDAVQQMGERELAIRSLDRNSNGLRQIRNALQRIANDTYGICLNCDENISPKRLTAVPWAAFCIGCQERIDRREIEIDEKPELQSLAA
jgi:DnaK suppressor protein